MPFLSGRARLTVLQASQNFITRVPESTTAELQEVVQAAAAAQPVWAQLTPARRRKCMMNLLPIFRQYSSKIVSDVTAPTTSRG